MRNLLKAIVCVFSFAGAARATPNFPGAIQRELGLQNPPACTICHATDQGGTGTVVKPFGIYVRSRGLIPFDEASLHTALQAAAGERHDSSGTGVSDIDKLKAGQDPNPVSAGTGSGPAEAPTHGCSMAGGSPSSLLPFAVLVAGLLHRRFRRRRSARVLAA
jgi:MYXO-CTERM domain-containing protein